MKVNLPDVDDQRFIVITNVHSWGKAVNLPDAIKNAKVNVPRHHPYLNKKVEYRGYLVHKDVTVDGMGGLNYPQDFTPVYLGKVK